MDRTKVSVCKYMVRCKVAAMVGDTLHVSPAMHDLMINADVDELERLMKQIKVIHLPDLYALETPMPITTCEWRLPE